MKTVALIPIKMNNERTSEKIQNYYMMEQY